MTVKGEIQPDERMFLRQVIADGVIEEENVEISLNISGDCVIIRFPDSNKTVTYRVDLMIADAYELCFPDRVKPWVAKATNGQTN